MPDPLAIIPSFVREPEDLEILRTAIASLRETEPELELLVVDDGSPGVQLVDELASDTSRFQFELHRSQENQGFSRTVNVGLRRALQDGRDAILVNADIEFIDSGWVRRFQSQEKPNGQPADVVGARLLFPNGLIQHGGIYFSLLTRTFDHRFKYGPADLPEAQYACVCPVTGALQYIRHETLATVGVYDDRFRMGWEDVDYALRVFLAGGMCVYQPTVRAYHHESIFRGRPSEKVQAWQQESYALLMEKYKETNFAQFVPSL